MSPKKNPRSQAAQQLIEDLLDAPSAPSDGFLHLDNSASSFGPVDQTPDDHLVIDGDVDGEGSLHLEVSEKIVLDPIAKAQKSAMTEKGSAKGTRQPVRPQARQPVRPPTPQGLPEDRQGDVDFGAMSTVDSAAPTDAKPPQPSKAPPAVQEPEERTMKVQRPAETLASPPETRSEVIPITRGFDRGGATEIRSGVKVPPAPKPSEPQVSHVAFSSSEAALKQSESLRIAQGRITELERELERVRRDNEALSTAGDTLRRRTDELASKAESFEIQAREASQMLDEEKKVLRGQLQAKDRENQEMRARVDEIETRLESNFKKIRVRERELEHRLEIVKMESATLIGTKDKMILDLKRQIDQLHHEGDSAKNKTQELFNQYKEKQETIRRVVRALRIALTILEGDDETQAPVKKA